MQPEDFLFFSAHKIHRGSRPAETAEEVFEELSSELKGGNDLDKFKEQLELAAQKDSKLLDNIYKDAGIASLFNITDLKLLAKAHEAICYVNRN